MIPLLFLLLATDLTGTWSGKREGPGGRFMETTFTFRTDGTTVMGTSPGILGESQITDVKIEGNTISFVVRMTLGGEERPMTWSGRFEGEEMVVSMRMPAGFGPPGGGRGPGPGFGPGPGPGAAGRGPMPADAGRGPGPGGMGELRLHKLTAEEMAAREAARLKPMPLPARRALPWNQLAATPPMGWNSYNRFGNNVTDQQVREITDAMVSSGMKAAGYQYIVIDDGWQGERDTRGRLQANAKFPDMKALAEYVHSKGLKLGLWATPGPQACSPGYPGSYGHEKEDAEQWAEWGMDYIKFDWCSAGGVYTREQQPLVYQKQAELLRATGRPMLFSICQYGDNDVAQWGAAAGGNMWRTTFDIQDNWQSMAIIGFRQHQLAASAGPGHWNDPDMLEVGNGGMTNVEYRTHFSLWAMASAPLIAGNDLRTMAAETVAILTNPEVIAVDQDKLGKGATRVTRAAETEVWLKPLSGGDVAVALFNRADAGQVITAKWSDLGISGKRKVRDLWQQKDLPAAEGKVAATVPSYGVVMLRLAR